MKYCSKIGYLALLTIVCILFPTVTAIAQKKDKYTVVATKNVTLEFIDYECSKNCVYIFKDINTKKEYEFCDCVIGQTEITAFDETSDKPWEQAMDYIYNSCDSNSDAHTEGRQPCKIQGTIFSATIEKCRSKHTDDYWMISRLERKPPSSGKH